MNTGGSGRRCSVGAQFLRAAALAATLTAVMFACGPTPENGQSPRNESGSGGSGGSGGEPIPSMGGEAAAATGGFATGDGGQQTGGAGAQQTGGAGGETPSCPSDSLLPVVTEIGDFGMAWNDSWFLLGCQDKVGYGCATTLACPDQNAVDFEQKGGRTLETFPIAGTPGQNYKVTFTFNALASAKQYQGGMRDQGTELPADLDHDQIDAFYRDGSAIPSSYGVWKLRVLDSAGEELRHYYMNSFPSETFPPGNDGAHRLFLLSYTKSIVVVGGGKVTHGVQEPDCSAVDNCGPGVVPSDESCPAPRLLPNEPTVLPPAMYQEPLSKQLKPTTELSVLNPTRTQPWHSQLGHLTITCVEETDDPVTTNYP